MPARRHRRSPIAGLAVAVLFGWGGGCTRGKEHAPAPEAPAPGTPVASPVEPATPASAAASAQGAGDWEAGVLPASIREGTPKEGGEATVHIRAEPPSLNTTVDSDWVASVITQPRIYEALLRIDPYDAPRFQVVPALAESWELSEDKKVYTFHLRRDVKWHDGRPFTARDVVATFDKIQDPTTKAAHVRSYTEELQGYKAVDDFTVQFTWKRPYFLTLDTMAGIPIQPAHVIGKMSGKDYNEAASNPLNRAPLGTGPFRFETWESNQKIVLSRNDAYWGKKPHLRRLVFRIVKDPTVALQLAEREELDTIEYILPDQWMGMKSEKLRAAYHRSKFYDASYSWIGWNAERPMFRDKRVRRALALLTDRPGVAEKIMFGLPKPTTCHFYWQSRECDPALVPLPFDPPAAVKLLEEAGWVDKDGDGVREKDGRPFRFSFMLPAQSVTGERIATKMKEDFGRAGIDLAIQKVEWSAFTKRLRTHEFDACTLSWVGDARGDPTQIWHSGSIAGGSNYVNFKNAEADKIMEDARVEFDEDKRTEMYRRFGTILHEEQPYTFLFVPAKLSLVHTKLRGVRETLQGWQFEDWWLESPPAGN
jgi:peptide/nickel transport system substrate-binding protein